MIRKALLLFIVSLPCLASVPTVEGLFRNAQNAEIQGDTVAVSFTIESKEKPRAESVLGLNALIQQPKEVVKKEGHYKLIFSVEENRPTPLLQVRYRSVSMEPSDVVDTFVLSNLESHIKREKVLEKQFFYALIQMFVLNSSEGFDSLLKKMIQNYRSNEDLVDPEKKRLYERYMTYLKQVKDEEQSEGEDDEELESPLRPKEEEEREKVDKIRAKRFYTDTGNIKLIRESGKFFWEVQLLGMRAIFTQEEHRLKELRLETLQGAIVLSVANYVLMDGTHELPQKFIVDHPEYGRFEVKFLSTQDFESQNTSFSDRVKEYRGWQENNLTRSEQAAEKSLEVIPYLY